MTRRNPADDPGTDGGRQVPARPHDSGSAANETEDGLDASTEALPARHRGYALWRHAGRCRENAGVRPGRSGAENLMASKRRGPDATTGTKARL